MHVPGRAPGSGAAGIATTGYRCGTAAATAAGVPPAGGFTAGIPAPGDGAALVSTPEYPTTVLLGFATRLWRTAGVCRTSGAKLNGLWIQGLEES